ncbi:MAG: cytochrome c biogenesis protein ResB [Candidatus Omnitrophica bacterium]|nr:cytochrome c biogenesis protein ResB [Candidatus Omnitrophota bacterium]
MKFKKKISKNRFVQFFASIKLTVICLFLLYILTFWGTVAQIQYGLYQAQNQFFHSLFFLVFGFIPFPGAQLVMWVLFVNLICVALTRFIYYSWRQIGILIIHAGLLLFLISGYVTLHSSHESYLNLKEGQASNVSAAYHDWEIAIWESSPQEDPLVNKNHVTAFDVSGLKPDQVIPIKHLDLQLTVKKFYKNCEAYTGDQSNKILSASGIGRLEPTELLKEPEKNTPGGIFQFNINKNKVLDVILYGGEAKPFSFQGEGKTYNVILRLKRYPLPFTLKLVDFKKEEHPGTDMARTYQSLVEILMDHAKREKLISMNDPLRYTDYTFYQSSFSIDKMGNESSVLAVVKNRGRLLPYISTFVTFLGLVIHFVTMAIRSRKD